MDRTVLAEKEHNPDALHHWCKELCNRFRAEARSKRRRAWKERLAHRDLSDVCSSLRKPRTLPISMVKVADLEKKWEPVLQAEGGEVDWDGLHGYLRGLPAQQLLLPPITAEQLQAVAQRMKRKSAPGADGWRPAEIKLMPREFLQRPGAHLCVARERAAALASGPSSCLACSSP